MALLFGIFGLSSILVVVLGVFGEIYHGCPRHRVVLQFNLPDLLIDL